MLHALLNKKKEFIQYRRHACKRECVSQLTVRLMMHSAVTTRKTPPGHPVELHVKTRGRQYVRPAGMNATDDDVAPTQADAPVRDERGANDSLDAKFIGFVKKHILINDIINDSDLAMFYDLNRQHAAKPSWSDVSELGEPAKHYLSQYDVIYLHNELLYREWESRDGTYTLSTNFAQEVFKRDLSVNARQRSNVPSGITSYEGADPSSILLVQDEPRHSSLHRGVREVPASQAPRTDGACATANQSGRLS